MRFMQYKSLFFAALPRPGAHAISGRFPAEDGRDEKTGPQGVWGPDVNLTPIRGLVRVASRVNLTLQKNYGMDEQGKDCPSVPAIEPCLRKKRTAQLPDAGCRAKV